MKRSGTARLKSKTGTSGARGLDSLLEDAKISIACSCVSEAGLAWPVLDVGVMVGVGQAPAFGVAAGDAALATRGGAESIAAALDALGVEPRVARLVAA